MITEIIRKKASGRELSFGELEYFVNGVCDNSIEDYKLTALISAMYINGLTDKELSSLTLLMAESGDMLDLSSFEISFDKHSSGGVGDKTSFIIAPVIASFGITVAKMSGRGLSHTGGTIDKLESIKGFNVNLKKEEFFDILKTCGCAITSQTGNICYADKRIYALRDVTGLVDSIPLIASSIMSKKIASGAKNIILDVKCGKGAFMKDTESATQLSEKMVNIGKSLGRNIIALVTDMNEPLGFAVGNSLEVIEAVEVLKGKYVKGLSELCEEICVNALMMTGLEKDEIKAHSKVKDAISSGRALEKFREFIIKQNGDIAFIDDYSLLPLATPYEIKAEKDGYIKEIDSYKIGGLSMALGGGRKSKEDKIDYGVGILLNKKTYDRVLKDEVIGTLYLREPLTEEIKREFLNAFSFSSDKVNKSSNIILNTVS